MAKVSFIKRARRAIGKTGRKVRGKLIKRYFNKGYQPKISQMSKDLAMLKSMVNAEKKKYSTVNTTLFVAQVAGNGSGHYLYDSTPTPVTGTTVNTRNGNSIKLHSAHYDFQFIGQSSMISGCKLKIQLVQVLGEAQSNISTAILDKFINGNPFTSAVIYDINCDRNPDYFKNFKVIRTKYVNIKADTISSETAMARVSMGVKFRNHHIRYASGTNTVTEGQFALLITADRGNQSGSVISTINPIPIQATGTGVAFSYTTDYYYYDN